MNNEISGFGVDIDFKDRTAKEINKIILYLQKINVKWVRVNLDVNRVSDKKYLEPLKITIELLHTKNIKVLGLITEYVPGNLLNLFTSNIRYKLVTDNLNHILENVEIIAQNFAIDNWEIWNEQNVHRFWHGRPSPKKYLKFYQKCSQIIKKYKPSSNIVFGGINGNDMYPIFPDIKPFFYYKNFLKKSLRYDIDNKIKTIAFHPYHLACYFSFQDKQWFVKKIKFLINDLVSRYPHHKFIVSEFGINPNFNFRLSIKDISDIYKELKTYCETIKVPFAIYNLIDDPAFNYSWLSFDNNFGFLGNNLNEKGLYTEFIKD